MASDFLDLAYLIEISIVFNLVFREIKSNQLINKLQTTKKEILNQELQNTISKCRDSVGIAEEILLEKFNKLNTSITKTENFNLKDENSLVNKNIFYTLVILFFATTYNHININFNYINDFFIIYDINKLLIFNFLWWILFFMLTYCTLSPIALIYIINQKQDKLLKNLALSKEEFVKIYKRFLKENATKLITPPI